MEIGLVRLPGIEPGYLVPKTSALSVELQTREWIWVMDLNEGSAWEIWMNWWERPDSNRRPSVFQTDALPAELRPHGATSRVARRCGRGDGSRTHTRHAV